MLRYKIIICSAVLLVCGLMNCAATSADVLGDCTLSGYTFMGGGSAYTNNDGKDYILAQPLNYDYSGSNMWGYGWFKFDVGTETVDHAYVVFDLLGVGSMGVVPATPAAPAYLDVYDPGATDVASLTAGVTERQALRDYLDDQSPLSSTTMTANGMYSVDITDIYNAWVADDADNNGLVFSTIDDGSGAKYAGFGSAGGTAPFISTAPVPEPSTLLLLAAGVSALTLYYTRRK